MNMKGRLLLVFIIALCIFKMVLFSDLCYEQSAFFNPFDYPVNTSAYISSSNNVVPILLNDGIGKRQLQSYGMVLNVIHICIIVLLAMRILPLYRNKNSVIYNEGFKIRKLYSAYFNGSKYKSAYLIH